MLQGALDQFDPNKKATEIDLFANGNFSQWTNVNGQPVQKGWRIENGVVHRFSKGGDIITKETYKDFALSFEWKISKAGNSGVKYRTQGKLGLEYQMLDDLNHRDNQISSHLAGSLYDLVPHPRTNLFCLLGSGTRQKLLPGETLFNTG